MSIVNVLSALTTALSAVDPSPAPGPAATFVYPADSAGIITHVTTIPVVYPFIIVSRNVGVEEKWGSFGNYGVAQHHWVAELLFFLSDQVINIEQGAAVETNAQYWLAAVAAVLRDNEAEINVRFLGTEAEELFTAVQGHINWINKFYWGFRVLLPITEEANL